MTNFFNIRFFKRVQEIDLQKISSRQLKIYHIFLEKKELTKRDLARILTISEDTALRELKVLMSHNLIKKQGEGKSTTYILA